MKNEDHIKDYLDRHREEFDDAEAPDIWESIEADLPQPKREEKLVPLRRVWQVAAGVAVLIGAAWIFSLQNEKTELTAVENTESSEEMRRYPELEEAGLYYQTKIEAAGEELKSFSLEEEDLEMIQILEDELEELRQSLGNEADDQQVVEAMIQIYRYKLDLMRDLLDELKNENQNGEDEDIVVVPL
jgi:hypothetical protein